MTRILLPFPLQRPIAEAMAPALGARVGRLDWRRFPDGESLVAVEEALSVADVAIHAVFAEDSYTQLLQAGAARVVSTDSIPHLSNSMSISEPLAVACSGLFGNGISARRLVPPANLTQE